MFDLADLGGYAVANALFLSMSLVAVLTGVGARMLPRTHALGLARVVSDITWYGMLATIAVFFARPGIWGISVTDSALLAGAQTLLCAALFGVASVLPLGRVVRVGHGWEDLVTKSEVVVVTRVTLGGWSLIAVLVGWYMIRVL